MKFITLTEAADLLETAEIIQSIDAGHAITHIGTDEAGNKFVMLNNCDGETTITYM